MRNTPNTAGNGWHADTPVDPANWIPLSQMAVEGFGRAHLADTIEARTARLHSELREHVILDDIGRACVPRSLARQMFAEQRAAREREHTRRTRPPEPNITRQRVAAIQARQADIGDADLSLSERALLNIAADDFAAKANRTASNLEDFLGGGAVFHRLAREDD